MKKLNLTIIYDSIEEEEREKAQAATGERPPLVCEQVEQALSDSGHNVKRLAVGPSIRDLAKEMERDESDLIFNLCESLGGISHFEQNVAALLEVLGKRFTGAGSFGLALAQDKALSKKIFSFHDIRYPKFSSIDSGEVEWSDDLSFPLFVKPLNQDASIGIDSSSIVHNVKELMERISFIKTEYKAPALIEEFIEGRELYVGVLGNEKPEALPILEWDFSKVPDGLPRIASSTAKWDEKSGYQHAPQLFPKDIPEAVYKRIQETAVQAFKSLKLRDYGRVDLRLRPVKAGESGGESVAPGRDAEESEAIGSAAPGEQASAEADGSEFFVIEVNPNPHLDIKSEFPIAAREHGLTFAGLLEKITELAMARNP